MAHDDRTLLFPDTDTEAEAHTASPTAHLLDELALYGHRPGEGEPDPRPMPEADAVQAQLDAMVEAFSAMLSGTRLEDDLSDLLWSFLNLSHPNTHPIHPQLAPNQHAPPPPPP